MKGKFTPGMLVVVVAVWFVVCGGMVGIGLLAMNSKRVSKSMQYDQRVLYERWEELRGSNKLHEFEIEQMREDEKVYKVIKPAEREQTIAECQKRIAENNAEIKQIESQCKERWGYHPSHFENLPGTQNKYYRE